MSKVFINEETLTNIGNAIREKTGKIDLIAPGLMAEEIKSISGGGSSGNEPTNEDLTITGNCNYRFAYGGWDWLIEKYGNRITTKDIVSATNMFDSCRTTISFPLNFNPQYNIVLKQAFYNYGGTTLPPINNVKVKSMPQFFSGAYNIKSIPDDFTANWDWSAMDDITASAYAGIETNGMFQGCSSLRKIPLELVSHGNPNTAYSYAVYVDMAWNCYCLDEIINLPNPHYNASFTSTASYNNVMNRMLNSCFRLKNFTFADFGPVQWKGNILDMSVNVGWSTVKDLPSYYNINFPEGIGKEIVDDASYQLLKNDPDCWTCDVGYSRYNHDSAVATINSLPDSSAFGANTVKFKGDAGSKTDGGAINTLTDEEIAVATAKGWTVAFV